MRRSRQARQKLLRRSQVSTVISINGLGSGIGGLGSGIGGLGSGIGGLGSHAPTVIWHCVLWVEAKPFEVQFVLHEVLLKLRRHIMTKVCPLPQRIRSPVHARRHRSWRPTIPHVRREGPEQGYEGEDHVILDLRRRRQPTRTVQAHHRLTPPRSTQRSQCRLCVP